MRTHLLSYRSTLSCASLISALSLLSIGSIISIGSVGSTASVFSVGSVASVLSIGSIGCVFGFFDECAATYPYPEAIVNITLSEDAWDDMASCSKDDYRKYKAVDAPDSCDYKPATCSYWHIEDRRRTSQPCRVRRKGGASWRALDRKPSFKIKWDDNKVRFASFECTTDGSCPPGETANIWESKKVTLNHQVHARGEVSASGLFRNVLGYSTTPLAIPAKLNLYRGDSLRLSDDYVMVETISDKHFMRKHFGDDYLLFEKEVSQLEFKRGGGIFDEDDMNSTVHVKKVEDAMHLRLAHMRAYDVAAYYAGERLTHHFDGACLRASSSNNHYIAFHNGTFTYIPSGMDQTFGCLSQLSVAGNAPTCAPAMECLADDSCNAMYEEFMSRGGAAYQAPSCIEEATRTFLTSVATCVVAAVVVLLVKYVGEAVELEVVLTSSTSVSEVHSNN